MKISDKMLSPYRTPSAQGTYSTAHTRAYVRKRTALLVLPWLLLPFLAMLFRVLGGGTPSHGMPVASGLNLQLPDPAQKDRSPWDKMSFYDAVEQDSLQHSERFGDDPTYRKISRNDTLAGTAVLPAGNEITRREASGQPESQLRDEILQKIQSITESIQQEPGTNRIKDGFNTAPDLQQQAPPELPGTRPDPGQGTIDPELQQVNETLDRIIRIERPLQPLDSPAVNGTHVENAVRVLTQGNDTCFHDLIVDNGIAVDDTTLIARVDITQTITPGQTLELRLENELRAGGTVIPGNTRIYGMTSLENDRLLVLIRSIVFKNRLIPVALRVFDTDGLPGIRVPGSLLRDASRQSMDLGLQRMQLLSYDPSLKLQAASAGMDAARNFLSKKARTPRVTVKAGYQVILNNINQQQ